jgi:hypothetical protein
MCVKINADWLHPLHKAIQMRFFLLRIRTVLHSFGLEACSETLNLPALVCVQIKLNSKKILGFGGY